MGFRVQSAEASCLHLLGDFPLLGAAIRNLFVNPLPKRGRLGIGKEGDWGRGDWGQRTGA